MAQLWHYVGIHHLQYFRCAIPLLARSRAQEGEEDREGQEGVKEKQENAKTEKLVTNNHPLPPSSATVYQLTAVSPFYCFPSLIGSASR
jgi:hypothetical protein